MKALLFQSTSCSSNKRTTQHKNTETMTGLQGQSEESCLSSQLLFISLAKLFSFFRTGDGRGRRLLLSVPFLRMWHLKNILSGWTQGWTVNELWSKIKGHTTRYFGHYSTIHYVNYGNILQMSKVIKWGRSKGSKVFFTVTALYSTKNALAIIQRHSSIILPLPL